MSSPFEEQKVIVEGVVTGDFQDGDADATRNLGGFYVQGDSDGDAATSDGIFVFDGNQSDTDVSRGDRVRVSGKVVEHFGETQIVASAVSVIGTGTVNPVSVSLPVTTIRNSDDERIPNLEAFEGMLVRFPQALTVSQLRNAERFGEVLLSEGGRQYAYTNFNTPDVEGFRAHEKSIASRRVYLDDGMRDENPGWLLPIRNGDEVRNLTGAIRFSRGKGSAGTEAWRVMPTETVEFIQSNPRPGAPTVAGNLRAATFNFNNFFSTIDNGRSICGPARDAACRGANNAIELSRQLEKIVTALKIMDAHVVAAIEIENNERASLKTVVDALNASVGGSRYDFVDAGTIGTDAIKVALIFQPGTVRPVGGPAILDQSVDPRFDDSRNRPVLAQSFDTASGNHRLTIVANHLKSKGSSCAIDGDPDFGDGQGNCSATRSLAAAAMIDWLATDPTHSGTDNILVIGDFNAYPMGDALARFETAGYKNVAAELLGPGSYSFEFNGQFGALDHAVASPELAPYIIDAAEWHINADEARIHDYNLEFGRDPSIFKGSEPYRASDHDPLIIGIDFDQ
jgi:predicted extracellular nuclease